ncbi:hypothetical protein Zmor_025778 [Zophobas morio]|uniref:BHLH domain-containing protein n=1 Tax=Zophobas morio TaxID=2755281 RepID=A0AA38M409_9CUCU|nr:hypothetical protein Zmor_025778 [Zophobas morio]
MKSENEKKVGVSETRKIRKPLMEKKRRARINDSLEALKQILLDSKATLKESASRRSGQRTAKLEKADILEMTVRYVQHLRGKLNQKDDVEEKKSCDSADLKMGVTLIPTKLSSGDIVFVMPSNFTPSQNGDKLTKMGNVWRPW